MKKHLPSTWEEIERDPQGVASYLAESEAELSDRLKKYQEQTEALALLDELAARGDPQGTPKDKQQEELVLTPLLIRMSDVDPEEVEWVWHSYIPAGKLTLLEGDPGVGKTWLALQLAAIVSRGDPFPGADGIPGERREPGNVVYLSAEDGLADTLRPRLDAAGADASRVFALTGWRSTDPASGKEILGAITLAHLEVIEETLKQKQPVLMVVDPIQAYLGAGVDMHRANEVRPILAGLSNLAEQYHCTVLCIRHLGKSQQDRAVYRGLGSIDFAAAARSILLAGADPNDKNKRVLAHVKSSLAPLGRSMGYELLEGKFYWTGVSDVTAEDLLSPSQGEEERSALDEAMDFLREALAKGAKLQSELFREGKKLGISVSTFQRAKHRLGIKSRRESREGEKRGKGGWLWTLQDDHQDRKDDSSKNPQDEHLDHLEENREKSSFPGHSSRCSYEHLEDSPESRAGQAFVQDDQDAHQSDWGVIP